MEGEAIPPITSGVVNKWLKERRPDEAVRDILAEWTCPQCTNSGGSSSSTANCHVVPRLSLTSISNTHDKAGSVIHFGLTRHAFLQMARQAIYVGQRQNGPLFKPGLARVSTATAWRIWCSKHDTALFAPIENGASWEGTREQCHIATFKGWQAAVFFARVARRINEEFMTPPETEVPIELGPIQCVMDTSSRPLEELHCIEKNLSSVKLDQWHFVTATVHSRLPVLGHSLFLRRSGLSTIISLGGHSGSQWIVIATRTRDDLQRQLDTLELDISCDRRRWATTQGILRAFFRGMYQPLSAMSPDWWAKNSADLMRMRNESATTTDDNWRIGKWMMRRRRHD